MDNLTTKYLSKFIFTPESLEELYDTGLSKVYVDDYGVKVKYENCLLFLFSPVRYQAERERTNNFDALMGKMSDFDSFYDYYEIKDPFESTMVVFNVPSTLTTDLFRFKKSAYQSLSEPCLDLLGLSSIDTYTIPTFHIEEEVYRFSLLSTK
jgi:hypothetical protein